MVEEKKAAALARVSRVSSIGKASGRATGTKA
jgi:hypothetical protein